MALIGAAFALSFALGVGQINGASATTIELTPVTPSSISDKSDPSIRATPRQDANGHRSGAWPTAGWLLKGDSTRKPP
jgi:hypothetical protein